MGDLAAQEWGWSRLVVLIQLDFMHIVHEGIITVTRKIYSKIKTTFDVRYYVRF